MADQGNDLDVENLDLKKRQHPCLFFLAISGTNIYTPDLAIRFIYEIAPVSSIYQNKRVDFIGN